MGYYVRMTHRRTERPSPPSGAPAILQTCKSAGAWAALFLRDADRLWSGAPRRFGLGRLQPCDRARSAKPARPVAHLVRPGRHPAILSAAAQRLLAGAPHVGRRRAGLPPDQRRCCTRCAACLVVLIVRRLSLPGAWLAGFVFALHPVCVEAVAWISEQKSTLSGVFYLAPRSPICTSTGRAGSPATSLALGLFVLALLSKTVTATLAGGAAGGLLVAARPDRVEARRAAAGSLVRGGRLGGTLHGVGGEEPPIHRRAGSALHAHAAAASPAGRPRAVVLRLARWSGRRT